MVRNFITKERALEVGKKVVCPSTNPSIKSHEDLGIWWKVIYWVTFIITFGSVKMTDFAFVLGSSMYMRDPASARPELIIHECVHMRQREKRGKLWWYFMYLFSLPTCFTMRSRYEGDAYAVSAVIESLYRVWIKEGRPGNIFELDSAYNSVSKLQKVMVNHYVNRLFRAWPYFFMACRKEAARKRLLFITEGVLPRLFEVKGRGRVFPKKEQRLLDAFISNTNIVEAARALFIK